MTDADDLDANLIGEALEDDLDDDTDEDLEVFGDEDETELDRTRVAYTGVNLDDEFQPVDAVELSEEGLLFDDPASLGDEPDDGTDRARSAGSLDPDDVGWDLDEE
jgi:hypothetical protein